MVLWNLWAATFCQLWGSPGCHASSPCSFPGPPGAPVRQPSWSPQSTSFISLGLCVMCSHLPQIPPCSFSAPHGVQEVTLQAGPLGSCCTLATGLGQRSKGGPSSSEQERLPWYLFPSPALQPEVWASLPETDDQKRACCWFLKCLVRSSSFLVHIVFWNYLMCNVWITDWTYTYGENASEAHGVDISTVCK